MHVLFLSDNFPPEVNAPASRTHEHCREWVAQGHQVTVITCAPNFPKGRVFGGYRNRLWQSETIDGIRVIRVWSYITANQGFLRRILDYISYMVAAVLAAIFVRRVDVIVGTSPQFFTALGAYLVSVLKWRPWVFELRDIWPASIKAVNAMSDSRILNWLETLELFLYRKADHIVAVTHAFKAELVTRGVAAHKISVITNGVDLSRYRPELKDPVLVNQLGLTGKTVVGYVGTHGMAHGLDTVLHCASAAQNDPDSQNLQFLFLGEGACKAELQAQAKASNLTNVIFCDSVSKQDITKYWALLDVALVHLKNDPLFQTVIPSKMFEAMGMGIPILHAVAGESADIVTRYGLGTVIRAECPDTMLDALKNWPQSPEKQTQLRANLTHAAKKFDRKNLANEMLKLVEKLT